MFLLNLLILLGLCLNGNSNKWQHYDNDVYKVNNHREAYKRIVQLMRSYYEEATARITYLNPIRFMFEESPYYEMGYITGEIIERYRKVLENTQKATKFRFLSVQDTLNYVESVQRLYFELYHLVRMLHETPRKWRNDTEFVNIEKVAGPELMGTGKGGKKEEPVLPDENQRQQMKELLAAQENLIQQAKQRAKERKRVLKKYKKLRQAFLKNYVTNYEMEKKPYNTKWPRDYGWEVSFNW